MSSAEGSWNKFFSHVYVEKRAMDYPLTKEILSGLPKSVIVMISHYKDIFNRGKQSYNDQCRSRALILAVNDGELVYEGAPVCQSFGEKEFYYTASSMNCPFDCEYCFLKGMYNTANIVCFVNMEDYARAVRSLKDPYVCVSYDTDLLAMDNITKQASLWADIAEENPDILIELRTKSAPARLRPVPNLIYAYTLSPDLISARFEHGAPPLKARLASIANALDDRCTVRLCFDPMIHVRGWEDIYRDLVDQVASVIDLGKVRDVSVGTFRISSSYLKNIRRQEPRSEVCWFPFENSCGYSKYPDEIDSKMQDLMTEELMRFIPREKIWNAKITDAS